MFSSAQIPQLTYECPACKCKIPGYKSLFFQGIHVLAEIECSCCELKYFQTIPIGHAAHFPVAFSLDNPLKSRFDHTVREWLVDPLINSFEQLKVGKPELSCKVFREFDEVILLNCLDDCFGHALLKLFNASRHLEKHPDKGLVVIISHQLEWLLPAGVAEAWIVNLPLKQLRHGVPGMNKWVHERIAEYDKFYISKSFIHPLLPAAQYSEYFKTARFELSSFSKADPLITFVWRDDRLWLRAGLLQKLELVARKWKWGWLHNALRKIQLRNFRRTAAAIRAAVPGCKFVVAGLGVGIGNLGWAQNEVKAVCDQAQELNWCKLYSRSNLVIGVHGSSMLIPSALAAGLVELVPQDKWQHYGEDVIPRQEAMPDLFLKRFLPLDAGSSAVALQAASMINEFPGLYTDYLNYQKAN